MTHPTTALRAGVAAEIRAELGRQGRSAAWLARQLDTYPQWLSRRLSAGDDTDLTVSDLGRIADALGVPAARLLPPTGEAA